jgi:hypothetical protein
VDLSELYLDQLLDMIYVLVVESGGLKLQALDDALDAPYWIERATWGQGRVAEEAHRAMMAMSGGPAPKRAPRPKPAEEPA